MPMTQLSARQTRMKVDETYRSNMKNKEPEAVNSASFSGEMASRKSFRIFIQFKRVF
jgi:hypothetical protein